MKFIADEGVDAPIVSALRNKGYDVVYILELYNAFTIIQKNAVRIKPKQ